MCNALPIKIFIAFECFRDIKLWIIYKRGTYYQKNLLYNLKNLLQNYMNMVKKISYLTF